MKLTPLDPSLPWSIDPHTHPETKELQDGLINPSGMRKGEYKRLHEELDAIIAKLCFRKSPLFVPGAVIQVKHVFDGRLATYLVGTMNNRGGLCDDCTLDDDDMIVAYAKIEIPFELD